MVSSNGRFVTCDEFSKRVLIFPFPVRCHVNTGYLSFLYALRGVDTVRLFSLIGREFQKRRLVVILPLNDIFGQNRLRYAATASLSRCLSFVCLLFETGSEMQRLRP